MDPVTGTATPIGMARAQSCGRIVQVRASGIGQFATAIVALIGVLVFVRFLWTKVEFSTEATGWVLLPAFAACCAMVVVAQIGYGARVVLGRSAPAVTAFMLYFCVRLVCDASSRSDVIGYTFGYAEGILFGYGTGLLVRLLLDALGRFGHPVVLWCGAMLLLGMNAWIAIGIEAAAQAEGQRHRLYSLIDNETYQVSGSLSSIVAIISWAVVMLVVDGDGLLQRIVARPVLLLCAIVGSGIVARLGQLLGSNAAPIFIGMASILALSVGAVSATHFGGSRLPGRPLARLSLMRELGGVAGWALVAGLLLVGSLAAAVISGQLDISQYRFFGFGQETLLNESLSARMRILERNFSTHLNYEPILGNFFVDRATTGDGSYAHSLIALVPHLGIVGTSLFVAMCISWFIQLQRQRLAAAQCTRGRRFLLLGLVVMLWSLTFMLVTTFFTNILFWFPLGLFAPGIQLRDPDSALRR